MSSNTTVERSSSKDTKGAGNKEPPDELLLLNRLNKQGSLHRTGFQLSVLMHILKDHIPKVCKNLLKLTQVVFDFCKLSKVLLHV